LRHAALCAPMASSITLTSTPITHVGPSRQRPLAFFKFPGAAVYVNAGTQPGQIETLGGILSPQLMPGGGAEKRGCYERGPTFCKSPGRRRGRSDLRSAGRAEAGCKCILESVLCSPGTGSTFFGITDPDWQDAFLSHESESCLIEIRRAESAFRIHADTMPLRGHAQPVLLHHSVAIFVMQHTDSVLPPLNSGKGHPRLSLADACRDCSHRFSCGVGETFGGCKQ